MPTYCVKAPEHTEHFFSLKVNTFEAIHKFPNKTNKPKKMSISGEEFFSYKYSKAPNRLNKT